MNLFTKASVKTKLICTLLVFIMIPLIILGIFSYKLYSKEIIKSLIVSAMISNQQSTNNIGTFMNMCIELTEHFVKDSQIVSMLKDSSEVKNSNVINTLLFERVISFSEKIDSTIIYGLNEKQVFGRALVDNINDSYIPQNEDWFKKTLALNGDYLVIGVHKNQQQLPCSEKIVSVARAIIDPDTKKPLAVLILNIKTLEFESYWPKAIIEKDTNYFLVDENKKIVYSYYEEQVGESFKVSEEDYKEYIDNNDCIVSLNEDEYYFISQDIPHLNWKSVILIPTNKLYSYISIMFYLTITVAAIIIIISIIAAIFIATSITRPLRELNQQMLLISNGDFDVNIKQSDGEVGEIAQTVKKMLSKIKELIQGIYIKEEERRIIELSALQAQINPHFLYNTLNSIKWMANIQGAKGIENSIASLSSMLSFIAKNTGDFVSVEHELKFLNDYIVLLNIRYYNKFEVAYQVDETVYKYSTIKLLLQPLVENAIFHGFEEIDKKGVLKISANIETDKLVFEICDNGIGIEKEKLEKIFEKKSKTSNQSLNSIGLVNVKERIRIKFNNEECGIWIYSELGKGTTARIVLPAILIKD